MIDRKLSSYIAEISRYYGVIGILGPRQSGKTTLARIMFPDYEYVNFEDQSILEEAKADLAAFMARHAPPVIFDEVQCFPEVLSSIMVWVDAHRDRKAAYVLTGSNQPHLRGAVSQSLAGRIALSYLLPLSFDELRGHCEFDRASSVVRGFMPGSFSESIPAELMYSNYFTTYVERDVNQLINLRDTTRFTTLLRLLAARTGQLINFNSLADEIGVSIPTIQDWITVMEASFIVFWLHPYYRNFGKRFVKTPKLYFTDVGLAAFLLGIRTAKDAELHPLFGQLFENMVIADIRKQRYNSGKQSLGDCGMYFLRDRAGNEVDLVLEQDGGRLDLFEIKSGISYNPAHARSIERYAKIIPEYGRGHVIYAGRAASGQGIDFVNFSEVSGV